MRKHNLFISISIGFLLFIFSQTSVMANPPKKKAVTAPVAAVEKTKEFSPPDIQAIITEGVLRVAILNRNQSPFFFKKINGELDGIDVTIAKLIAAELGVKVEFVFTDSFDAVVDAVYERKAHIGISKLSVTMKRSKKVLFAGEYAYLNKALLINRLAFRRLKSDEANTLLQIFKDPSASIGVISNSAYEVFARSLFPYAEVKTYSKWEELVEAVLQGEITAALRDEWEVRKTLDNRPDLPLYAEAIYLKDQNDPIKIAVPWDSLHLAKFIDTFFLLNDKYKYDVDKLLQTHKIYIEEYKMDKEKEKK